MPNNLPEARRRVDGALYPLEAQFNDADHLIFTAIKYSCASTICIQNKGNLMPHVCLFY